MPLGDYFGRRPVVLSLVYYDCPMLCTLTLNGLVSALDVLSFDAGREFEVVTVSFDPRETPELAAAKKAAYLQRYERPGAAEGWHFLTGDEAALRPADGAPSASATPGTSDTKQFAHPAGIMVLTPDGRIARYLYGIEYAPKDLRLALVEASAGPHRHARGPGCCSFCYQYDPATGPLRRGRSCAMRARRRRWLTLLGAGRRSSVVMLRPRAAAGAGSGPACCCRLPALPGAGLHHRRRASTRSTSSWSRVSVVLLAS